MSVLPVEYARVQNMCYVKLLTYSVFTLSRKTRQNQRLVCSQ